MDHQILRQFAHYIFNVGEEAHAPGLAMWSLILTTPNNKTSR